MGVGLGRWILSLSLNQQNTSCLLTGWRRSEYLQKWAMVRYPYHMLHILLHLLTYLLTSSAICPELDCGGSSLSRDAQTSLALLHSSSPYMLGNIYVSQRIYVSQLYVPFARQRFHMKRVVTFFFYRFGVLGPRNCIF